MHPLAERFPHLTGRIIMISTRAKEDYAELMADTPTAGFLGKSALSVQAIRTPRSRPALRATPTE